MATSVLIVPLPLTEDYQKDNETQVDGLSISTKAQLVVEENEGQS